MRTAFVELGVKGYPMAEYCAHAGHQVVVYNRTREKLERWAAEPAPSPTDAAANVELVKACGRDVRAITKREGDAFATLGKHPVFVDPTSTKPTRNLALFAEISLARPIEALAEALILPEQQGSIHKPLWTSSPKKGRSVGFVLKSR